MASHVVNGSRAPVAAPSIPSNTMIAVEATSTKTSFAARYTTAGSGVTRTSRRSPRARSSAITWPMPDRETLSTPKMLKTTMR